MTVLSPPPPSWTRPIVLGALFAVFVELLPLAVAQFLPEACLFVPFCCAVEALPIGILPAVLAVRQEPGLSPGEGFKVSFIAGGLGSIVVALMLSLQLRGADTSEAETSMREQLVTRAEQMRQADPNVAVPSSEEIDAMVAQTMEWLPYLPVVGACVMTVFAGLCGLATVRVLRRRQSVMPPPMP